LKVVVNVTTTFSKWNLLIFFILWSLGKRIVFFLLPEAFCDPKHAENASVSTPKISLTFFTKTDAVYQNVLDSEWQI